MKKSLLLSMVLLATVLCTPATSSAKKARIDLAASGGAALCEYDEFHGYGVVSASIQVTWPVTSWLELGFRKSFGVSAIQSGFTGDDAVALLPNTHFITRFHAGDRVRLSAGLGYGFMFSSANGIMMFLPFPNVAADLDVVLYRKHRHELTLRAGADAIILYNGSVVAQPRAGLTWSF